MKILILLILSLGFTACGSKEKKVEIIDSKLEQSQTISAGENIGMNKEGDLVYQRKANLVSELVKLEDEVTQLQDRVYGTQEYNSKGLYGKALGCRKEKAIKTGEMSYIPERSPVIEEDQVKIGQDLQTKKLISIAEEVLTKRVDRFKEYKKVLYSRQEELEKYIEKCEVELKRN